MVRDDALAGIGQPGRIALAFTRDAPSAEEALVSALADVKRAIPTARLIEAAPDFVGLTDVADMLGMTRQDLRKLMTSHSGGFPIPLHEGCGAVWHLADILVWLQENGADKPEQSFVEVAQTAMQINLAKQACQLVPEIQRELQALVA